MATLASLDHTQSDRQNVVSISSGSHRERVLESRDQLATAHLSMVPPIAARILKSLPPSFEIEDLIATGNLALLHLAVRYRPRAHRGTPFAAYARKRLRGAILDSVRRRHWTAATMSDNVPDTAIEPDVSPITIDAERLLKRVALAIGQLSPLQASILQLYYSPERPPLRILAIRFGMSARRVGEERRSAIGALKLALLATA